MGTDIVPFQQYEIGQVDPAKLLEAVEANLGGQKLSENDLDVVKLPSGGGMFFEVPDLEDAKAEKTLTGVIVAHKAVRAFWRESIGSGGGGQPPDCYSPDNTWGFGDPGDGLRARGQGCEDCPMAQFGTATNDDGSPGRGQACKQSHLLFLVRPEDMLPLVLRLPPTSLQPTKKFLMRLSGKAVPYYAVVVEIGLDKKSNADNTDYAQATFKMVARLGEEEAGKVKAFGDSLRPLFERTAAAQAQADSPNDDAEPPPAAAPAAEPTA